MLTEADIRRLAGGESLAGGFGASWDSTRHTLAIAKGILARNGVGLEHHPSFDGPYERLFCYDNERFPELTESDDAVTREYTGVCVYLSLLVPYAAWGRCRFHRTTFMPPRTGGVESVPWISAATAMDRPARPDVVEAAILDEIASSPYELVLPAVLNRKLPPDLLRPVGHCPLDTWETWFDALFFINDV